MSEHPYPESIHLCTKCGAEVVTDDSSGLCQACLTHSPSGRKAWEPPTAAELAVLLPQYDIESLLGRGGMGAVYKGIQRSLERPVAIKILSAEIEDRDSTFVERFKNEARAMARLKHPGIVDVYDSGETADGMLYIVMEFIEGTDVSRMIAKQGRLHTDHAMAITAHVCDALAYAHERGIIHRDIKPANIMVSYEGVVKVADFGLAKVSNDKRSGLTQSGMAMGTLHYMAPEALTLGSAVDHRADLYAMGVMLYQMLAGKLPQGMFKLPSQQIPGIDPRYDRIITKAMQDDRESRYSNALEMRQDLDAILTQPVVKVPETAAEAPPALNTHARPQRPAETTYRPPPPRPVAATEKRGAPVLWAAIIVLTALAGWLYLKGERQPLSSQTAPTSSGLTTTPAPSLTTAPIVPAITTPSPVVEPGFTPLLDATHTSGWQEFGGMKAAKVANGVLTLNPSKSFCGAYWYSAKTFRDFVLRFQFRLQGTDANSGVMLRFTTPDEHEKKLYYVNLSNDNAPIERTGAIMFVKAPTANPQKVGEWNDMEITATEQRYRVTVNGVLVNNFTGDRSLSGYIGLQLGRPLVQFRNIRIKELNATNPPLPVTGPTTWTDTKGRSITATFKSIQDSNVLLDIAGKITPVPMNTLSRESQNLARSYSPRSTPPIRPMTSQPTAASEFTPERFPSGLAMFGYHLPSKILNSNATSNTVSTLQKLYEACVNREIELCTTNAGRQSDLEWFVAERARVNGKVFPSGTTNPALPESLQKLQAAYWKTAVALDTVLDSKQ